MKKLLLAVALTVVPVLVFAAPGLSKAKRAAQPVKTGPGQFIQSSQLSSGVGATITVVGDWSEETRTMQLIGEVLTDLSRIDASINAASEGEVTKINSLKKGEKLTLSDDMFMLMTRAQELADQTKGWFDITNKNYKKVSLDDKDKSLTFKANEVQVDLSNILPAYLVDIALAKLVAGGVANAKVEVGNVTRNIGQDIYTPWNVSVDIPNPNSANAYHSYVYSFSNKAVASLRNSESQTDNFKNVTVFGGDSMTASAFAVAFYQLGPKYAPAFVAEHPEVKGIFVDGEGKLSSSRDLIMTHKNYDQEDATAAPQSDRGPNDLNKKRAEESKD